VAAPDALDAKVAGSATAPLQGGPKSQAAQGLIRAADRPIDDALVEGTARRIFTWRATPGLEGLKRLPRRRPAAWVRTKQ
jgi:hypothetical protein